MVRWMKWHCLPDTGFEILVLAARGLARYLPVTEAPHNIWIYTSERGRNILSTFQADSFNHCTNAPAQSFPVGTWYNDTDEINMLS